MIDIPTQALLEQIAHVASESGAPISANQVAAVLGAYRNILGGDAVGTVRRDPQTGALAHRVNDDGLHMWRVTGLDGTHYNDLQPQLPWPIIAEANDKGEH